MEKKRLIISLDASHSFVTDSKIIKKYNDPHKGVFTDQSSYLIKKGEVFVYVTEWKKQRAVKLCQLGSFRTGDVIPTLAYQDDAHVQWRFIIKAKAGDAELEEIPQSVTTVLRNNFAKKAGLSAYEGDGFERSIIEQYRARELNNQLLDALNDKENRKASENTAGLIINLFSENDSAIIQDDDQCMKVIKYICSYLKHPVNFEKIKQTCSEDLSIRSVANAAQLLCREVILEEKWYRDDYGIIIGLIDKDYVACVPKGFGYEIYNPTNNKQEKVTKEIAEKINPKAFSIERSFPSRALQIKDLIQFGIKELYLPDVLSILGLGLVTTLIGILLPTLNQKIYDDYIPMGDIGKLAQICLVIGAFMIGNLFFSIVKSLSEFRMQSRIGYRIQDAAYHRTFRLPETFFRVYDSADLAQRIMSIGSVINSFISSAVISGLSVFYALLYLVRMFRYESKLTGISILMLIIQLLFQILVTILGMPYSKKIAEQSGKASSKLYQYLNGISKIRMAGAEERAIYDYMIPYTEIQATGLRANRLSSVSMAFSVISSTIYSMILYYVMIHSKMSISIGAFIGFNTAFGAFAGAFNSLIEKALALYQMKPIVDRFRPVFETACEDTDDKDLLDKLTGAISISQVSFTYSEGSRMVIDNLSLNIKAGEYIGIVGSSGCGKSTLIKLLLGFETPSTGQILYDNNDIKEINKHALRKQMGVVLQNGKLIAGSIYENITITAPQATRKDVEKVIEEVGLKDDISKMPMGLETVLSENSGTISGGQQQRILIARAIISKPSILLFDEATSALDNITQDMVSDSLDKMRVTRIVVAHRLSTIKNCDRIIVMDQGKIVEEGTYNELMKHEGLFYELAARQIAEGSEG